MKKQIEKVKKLKSVYLEYEDGSVISIPENQTLKVGTAFMKTVGKERLDWKVVRLSQPSIAEKIRRFFTI